MSIYMNTLKCEGFEIDLKASDYNAPHATIQVEFDNATFEMTLDKKELEGLVDMLRTFLGG